MLFILFLELFLTVGYILFSRKLFILQNPIICMITGRSGRKEVAHVENLYSSRRISTATLKRRGISVLNSAKKSIMESYEIGMKDWNKALDAVKAAKNPAAKAKAQVRLKLVDAKLKELVARRKKANALIRQIKSLK